MIGDGGYETPAAVRSALTTAIKQLPKARRGAAVREFVRDRFLCRVFALDEPWVLKGGTAMLARVADARHTKDIDLWNETHDLDVALASIERAITLDLGDHLTFTIGDVVTTQAGRQLVLEAYLGATQADRFKVDIVVGSLVTAPIENVEPANRITLTRLGGQHPYRLYPLVDHLADKVCAIHELHNGNPSTRVRDLVDVLVYAATESVDGAALRIAIASEALHRGMGPIVSFEPPAIWAAQFARVARDAASIIGKPSYAEAVEAAAAFIQPALHGGHSGTWSPAGSSWI
jgi:hypothetical protein